MRLFRAFFVLSLMPGAVFAEIATEPQPEPVAEVESVVEVQSLDPRPHGGLTLRWNETHEWQESQAQRSRFSSGKLDLFQVSADGRWSFESGAFYREFIEKEWLRDQTRITYRAADQSWALTLGDFAPSYRGFQESPLLLGAAIRSSMIAERDRTSYRRSTTELVIRRRSLIEIFVGDQLFLFLRREPGVLDLREFALLRNRKDVRVRVRDEFGQEDEHRFQLFSEVDVLPEGGREFALQAGSVSLDQPTDRRDESGEVMAMLSYREAWNSRLTWGLNYQNLTYRHMLGAEAATRQATGLYSFEGAGTQVDGTQGFAGRFRWKNLWGSAEDWVSELTWEERSEFFIPTRPDSVVIESVRRRLEASVVHFLRERTTLGVGLTQDEVYARTQPLRLWRVDAAWIQGARSALSLSLYQRENIRPEHGVRLSWSWFERSPVTVQAWHDSGDQESQLQIERRDQGQPEDGMLRLSGGRNTDSGSVTQDDVDLRSEFRRAPFQVRLQGEDRRDQDGRWQRGTVGFDSSLLWGGEEVWNLRAPSLIQWD